MLHQNGEPVGKLLNMRNSLCHRGTRHNLNKLILVFSIWDNVITTLRKAGLNTSQLTTSLLQTKWYQSVSAVEAKNKATAERALIGVQKRIK